MPTTYNLYKSTTCKPPFYSIVKKRQKGGVKRVYLLTFEGLYAVCVNTCVQGPTLSHKNPLFCGC